MRFIRGYFLNKGTDCCSKQNCEDKYKHATTAGTAFGTVLSSDLFAGIYACSGYAAVEVCALFPGGYTKTFGTEACTYPFFAEIDMYAGCNFYAFSIIPCHSTDVLMIFCKDSVFENN